MKKSFKKAKGSILGDTVEGMNKIVQNKKMEIEATKKAQTKGILEMKNLGNQTGTTEVFFTNRR